MKYLTDSDFLVALYKSVDSNHKKAKEKYKKIGSDSVILALNLVFQESVTVISKQLGMQDAKKFYEIINKFIDVKIDVRDDLERASWELFLKQTKKGTSFIDCANLTIYQKYKLDGILSFDEFYKINEKN